MNEQQAMQNAAKRLLAAAAASWPDPLGWRFEVTASAGHYLLFLRTSKVEDGRVLDLRLSFSIEELADPKAPVQLKIERGHAEVLRKMAK